MGCLKRVVLIGLLLFCGLFLAVAFSSRNTVAPPALAPNPVAPASNAGPPVAAPAPAPAPEPAEISIRVGNAVVIDPGVPAAFLAMTDAAWDDMLAAERAGSEALMIRLIERGEVLAARAPVRAIVVKKAFASVYVQLTGGELAGGEGWIQTEYVWPDIPEATGNAKPARRRPRLDQPISVDIDSGVRAKGLLTMARNLEKQGNTKGALDFYRQVVKLAPDSAEAKAAREKIAVRGQAAEK